MKKIEELSTKLNEHNGVAIWVRVEGECCSKGTYRSKLRFVTKSQNHKCFAHGKNVEIGFRSNDYLGIADAIPGCIDEAIAAFDCTTALD